MVNSYASWVEGRPVSAATPHEPTRLAMYHIAYHKKRKFANKKCSRESGDMSPTHSFYQKFTFGSTVLAQETSSNSVPVFANLLPYPTSFAKNFQEKTNLSLVERVVFRAFRQFHIRSDVRRLMPIDSFNVN